MTTPETKGWYPDPDNPGMQRYFNGIAWTDVTDEADIPAPGGKKAFLNEDYAPLGPRQADDVTSSRNTGASQKTAVAIGVCVLSGIGLVMSMQSTSLIGGTGTIWTGVGLTAAGMAAAFFLGAEKWVRVVASALLVLAALSAGSMEKQLSDKRNELSRMLNPMSSAPTATSSATATPASIAPPGSVVRDEMLQFQITDVSSAKTIGDNPYLQSTANGIYVIFTLDVTNIGDEPQYVFPSEQKLIDTSNRQYPLATDVDFTLNGTVGQIGPGNTATVKMAFDVPQSLEMKALELHGDMLTGGVKVAAAAAA